MTIYLNPADRFSKSDIAGIPVTVNANNPDGSHVVVMSPGGGQYIDMDSGEIVGQDVVDAYIASRTEKPIEAAPVEAIPVVAAPVAPVEAPAIEAAAPEPTATVAAIITTADHAKSLGLLDRIEAALGAEEKALVAELRALWHHV
jgi:hypothetical protein